MPQNQRPSSSNLFINPAEIDYDKEDDVVQRERRQALMRLRSISKDETTVPQPTAVDGENGRRHGNKYFPIALVGIGCRFPGRVNSASDFWEVVLQGKDCLEPIPKDRWNVEAYYNPDPHSLGTHVNQKGGFVQDIDAFDNGFFKIAPKEALNMDPQQRHLLEVTHEAFEDAGVVPSKLGGKCGVYVGLGMMDYPLMNAMDQRNFNAYAHTGMSHSVAANRISFAFNLQGPSLATDTACASSMTALHLACMGLWNQECEASIVAGSNVLLMPEITCGFSALSVLSPESESRPFDAGAKGYVRSEGFGAILLKPLDDALRDGDNIYCTLLGTAIAANGLTPSITMPCREAQAHLMTSVYEHFQVKKDNLFYVEAHGTGTPVGDPIEAEAIGEALAKDRDEPLRIGSGKSNFGHLECAAGMISLVKVALMLKHRKLVPSINFEKPATPLFSQWNIQVQTHVEDFPEGQHMIGVNNYGFGGALAHAIMAEAPAAPASKSGTAGWSFGSEETKGRPLVVPLSARSQEALTALVEKWQAWASQQDAEEVVGWLGARREHHAYRLAVMADSGASFRSKLQAYLNQEEDASIFSGSTSLGGHDPRVAFVFPGQGQQSPDMGRQLYAKEPVFREAVDRCDSYYKKITGQSLLQISGLFRTPDPSETGLRSVDEVEISQPAILFMQVGLVKLWSHWGVTPACVVGHSFGELAAAFASGLLSLKEAVMVVCIRSQLQKSLQGTGSMAAVRRGLAEVEPLLEEFPALAVACVNSPGAVTLAGAPADIRALVEAHPSLAKQLRVQCAFHTPSMDVIRDQFLSQLDGKLLRREASLPFYSTVTGSRYPGSLDELYWWRNVREPVNFVEGVRALLDDVKPDVVIELSSAATLLACVGQIAGSGGPQLLNSCQRGRDDSVTALKALASLHVQGVPLDWDHVTNGKATHAVLPSYPWQKRSFWHEAEESRVRRLGLRDRSFKGLKGQITVADFPFLKDHVIQDNVVFPAAGYVEFAVQHAFPASDCPSLKDLQFKQVLALDAAADGKKAAHLQEEVRSNVMTLRSQHAEHAQCTLARSAKVKVAKVDVPALQASLRWEMKAEEVYAQFHALGLQYGPHFQVLERVWVGDKQQGESLCQLKPAEDRCQRVQVALLDGCLQGALFAADKQSAIYLPVAMDTLQMHVPSVPLGVSLLAHCKLVDINPSFLSADITLMTSKGDVIMTVTGFRAQSLQSTQTSNLSECVFERAWQPRRAVLPDKSWVEPRLTWDHARRTYPEEAAALDRFLEEVSLVQGLAAQFARRAVTSLSRDEVSPKLVRYYDCLKRIADEVTQDVDLEPGLDKLKKATPDMEIEVRMFRKLGELLPASLTGSKAGVEVLFAHDGLAEYFLGSVTTTLYYKMVSDIVKGAVEKALTQKKVVRVLEVGGRMGGLSRHLCQALAPELTSGQVDYVLTDLTKTFFLHAQQTLKDYPQVRFKELDIEQPVSQQGFMPNTFDVVVCLDSLHSVVDVEVGLGNMRDLLAPDGWLVMMEGTGCSLLREIIFGCLELCWVYQDAWRRDSCWMTQAQWCHLLERCGFRDVTSGPAHEEVHSIIVANKTDGSTTLAAGPSPSPAAVGEESKTLAKTSTSSSAAAAPAEERFVVCSDSPSALTALQMILKEAGKNVATFTSVDDVADSVTSSQRRTRDTVILAMTSPEMTSWMLFLRRLAESSDEEASKLAAVWFLELTPEGVVYPHPAMTTGFIRVAINELRQLPLYSLVVEDTPLSEARDSLLELFSSPPMGSREYLLKGSGSDVTIHVPKLVKSAMPEPRLDASLPWQLAPKEGSTGSLDALHFRQSPRLPLGPGEVRIQVKAASLNFKDVMATMGLLEGVARAGDLGLECAGVVTQVGSTVTRFKPGDHVIALGDRCLAQELVTSADFVLRKPASLSWEKAAGVGIVFLTAWEALGVKAGLQAGETVLVHAATGGVGQAAVQVARMLGAKVIATAGTEEKRQLLRSKHGVALVSDSRSTDFLADVMKWTDGRGVDVVLNSLAGEKLGAGLSALAEGGRFCEIGKRDILDDRDLGLRVLLENKSFLSVQLDLLMRSRPERVKAGLVKIGEFLEQGAITPIMTTVFPFADYSKAFKFMMSGSHIGKLVLDLEGFSPSSLDLPSDLFDPEALYLVTGANGGLGLSLLRWMAKRGCRHIVSITRSGFASLEQKMTVRHLASKGVTLHDLKSDCSSPDKLKAEIEKAKAKSGLPLKGVFHLAGVTEDDAIMRNTSDRVRLTLKAKAEMAYNLHLATVSDPLEVFFMTSSSSTMFGNLEQGSYVAANSYLEALAQARHRMGLPAVALQLGAVAGAGMAQRVHHVLDILKGRGLLSLHVQEVTESLDCVLRQQDKPLVSLSKWDWDAVFPNVCTENCAFKHLLSVKGAAKGGEARLTQEEMEQRVRGKLASVLDMAEDEVALDKPMVEYGVDSLMAVEMVNWLSKELDITTSQLDILGGISTTVLIQNALQGTVALKG